MEIINAKYDSAVLNDALTINSTDFFGLLAKVTWPTAFFFRKKVIFYSFCMTWESAHEVYLNYNV